MKRRLSICACQSKHSGRFSHFNLNPAVQRSSVSSPQFQLCQSFQKGRLAMSPSPEIASPSLPVPAVTAASLPASQSSGDMPYMTMTVLAILLLLGSLWIF